MPGLLDFFTGGADANQNQGLLAAAAQMLQQSGPSRMPTSIGQIVGGGLTAYNSGLQNAQDRDLQLEQARQVAQLRDFAIRDKQSDLETQDAQRARAQKLLSLTSNYWQGGQAPTQPMPAGQSAASMFQGAMSSPGGAPMTAGAQTAPAATAPTGGLGLDRGAMTNQRIAYAQFLRQNGYGAEAQAEEDSALKMQPKVKEWQKVNVAGKTLYAPYFEDGTNGQPVPLEVAEKLDTINRGGSTDLVNAYTGATVRSLSNSATPGELIAAATQRRGQDITVRGQDLTNARALDQIAANGSKDKAPTEFQGKSAAYALRATEADKILSSLQGKYSPAAINSKNTVANTWLVGGALGAATNKLALNANDQSADQAQRDFINAVLRQESGAAIGAGEFDNAAKQYFPQPGDLPATLAQKARGRALAIQGLQANAGKFGLTAPSAPATGGWSITKVE
jgi:hypothetical protein